MNPKLKNHLEVSNIINWVGFYQWKQAYDQKNIILFNKMWKSIRGDESE
jgi:hypothetical protein